MSGTAIANLSTYISLTDISKEHRHAWHGIESITPQFTPFDDIEGHENRISFEIEHKLSSEVLYTILDENQSIIRKTIDETNADNSLNTFDPNWKYNLTLGDIQKRRITLHNGRIEELWFPMEKSIRKVFIAFKVKRVSEVDNATETFQMRFHIYFNWLATEEEYRSYIKAKQNKSLINWEPNWYPNLKFPNMIKERENYWKKYHSEGKFRMMKFKDFAKERGEIIPEHLFDCESARFLRAKLECEMTFSEELELQSFPFDCQDLSCVILQRNLGDVRCVFLPELRTPYFATIDPKYSVIDEWDLETAILEFGDADSKTSQSGESHSMIILRLKIKRRWIVYLWNIIFLMFCIMGLAMTAFAVHYEDLGDRLILLITLALTIIIFSYAVFYNLPKVSYLTWMDKYIFGSFVYIVVVMIESAFLEFISQEIDYYLSLLFLFVLIAYQVIFMLYAYVLRKEENKKLYFNSDQIAEEVNASHPSLMFDYSKGMRSGNKSRLLSFFGNIQASEFID